MKLTNKEQQYLEKLIKRENQYFRLRYINMALAILCILLAFGALTFFIFFNEGLLFKQYSSHPMLYLLFVVGGIGIGHAIRGWRGDPVSKLLIKVVEELSEKEK